MTTIASDTFSTNGALKGRTADTGQVWEGPTVADAVTQGGVALIVPAPESGYQEAYVLNAAQHDYIGVAALIYRPTEAEASGAFPTALIFARVEPGHLDTPFLMDAVYCALQFTSGSETILVSLYSWSRTLGNGDFSAYAEVDWPGGTWKVVELDINGTELTARVDGVAVMTLNLVIAVLNDAGHERCGVLLSAARSAETGSNFSVKADTFLVTVPAPSPMPIQPDVTDKGFRPSWLNLDASSAGLPYEIQVKPDGGAWATIETGTVADQPFQSGAVWAGGAPDTKYWMQMRYNSGAWTSPVWFKTLAPDYGGGSFTPYPPPAGEAPATTYDCGG